MFLSPLNDTTLSSIRKSIFVYAAFVYVVYNYNIHIPAGASFFDLVELGKGVKITQGDLLFVGTLIQAYLLVRLALLVPVSLAVLEDEWGAETLKRNEELNKLAIQLKGETRDEAAQPWPQQDISAEHLANLDKMVVATTEATDISAALYTAGQNAMENNRELYNEVNETLLELQRGLFGKQGKNTSVAQAIDTFTLPQLSKPSEDSNVSGETAEQVRVKTVLQRSSGLLQMLNMRIQNLAGNDLRDESQQVAALKNTLKSKVEELKVNVAQVEGYLRYLQDFEAQFDKSTLALAINPKASPLLQRKPLRKLSFFVFEASVPALVAVAAMLPQFTDYVFTSIFS